MDSSFFKTLLCVGLLALVLHSCKIETSNDAAQDYATADLLGTWNVKTTAHKHPDIESVKLVNDAVAEVVIKDLSGKQQQISGKWERNVKQSVGRMDFSFDFKLSYHYDHLYALMGRIEEADDNLTISVGDLVLEKSTKKAFLLESLLDINIPSFALRKFEVTILDNSLGQASL
ncbi:hypothetical protein [Leeuwenhoekiella marinoflava]|uniref:Uncharacterized protein n=2 Tax=Leeuwenhoekiella marinoflava TaxID=988 RepID=A0A4Q0PN65_9FLAO|nr:hypothetical protein [Leeuwenhoekiella marinoflava]RXG31927.1 hypothetical protein DSL99_1229 [Leeuwenhoekiella marinoflava]SHE91914.1 hypothetical protein SAMN02745246_01286 [Leeuwenhoekiella marinoflava DSM 3653]